LNIILLIIILEIVEKMASRIAAVERLFDSFYKKN